TLKIRCEKLDLHISVEPANFAHGFGEDSRAAIHQIVAIDGSNHGMFQPELSNSGSDASGFHQIVFGRTPAGYGAEGASARADVAQDHESRSPMFAPTLGDIGTQRILTNRIELVRTKNPAEFEEIFAARNANLQPIRTITHMWIAAPKTLSIASWVASARVGCAWIVLTRSSTVPSNAIAATASEMISVTVVPIM